MAFIEGWPHLRGGLYEGFHCSHKASRHIAASGMCCVLCVDVQVIADSVSGGSVPLSVLSTEDYLDQNGRIAVHATRLP